MRNGTPRRRRLSSVSSSPSRVPGRSGIATTSTPQSAARSPVDAVAPRTKSAPAATARTSLAKAAGRPPRQGRGQNPRRAPRGPPEVRGPPRGGMARGSGGGEYPPPGDNPRARGERGERLPERVFRQAAGDKEQPWPIRPES